MISTLSGHHKGTYETIFRHPTSGNIEWAALISLFGQIGEVENEPYGKLKFTRNGSTVMLHIHGKDAAIEQIMQIRHFLDNSSEAAIAPTSQSDDMMVVLNHAGARIFRSGEGDIKPTHVIPLDPKGHDQHVHNPKGDSGGKQGPLRKLFYEDLVGKLVNAGRILMVGEGQGASDEVQRFMGELKSHQHDKLAAKVVGTESIDLSHTTDDELAAKARAFFSAHTGLGLGSQTI